MEQRYFSNNATTTVVTDGGTTVQVTSASGFPTSYPFYLTLENGVPQREIVKVTSLASANTWNVTRAQEGTTQLTFSPGHKVELRVTAGTIQLLVDGVNDSVSKSVGGIQSITSTLTIADQVGIGTISPAAGYKLHTVGGHARIENTSAVVLQMKTTTGTTEIGSDSVGGYWSAPNGLTARILTAGSVRVTVLNSGFVGLGTTNPGAQLEVNGDVITKRTSGGAYIVNRGNFNQSPVYTFWDNDTSGISNPGVNEVGVTTNGNVRLRVVSGGNIAIGDGVPSNAPADLVHMGKLTGNCILRAQTGSNTTGNNAGVNLISGTASWLVGTEGGNGRFFIFNATQSVDQMVFSGGVNSAATIRSIGTGSVTIQTGGTNDRLVVNSAGTATYLATVSLTDSSKQIVNTEWAQEKLRLPLQSYAQFMATATIDVSSAKVFNKTISANTTFAVTNVPATERVASFLLDLINPGAFTLTWWTGVKWPGGSPPTFTVSGRDTLGFFTYDGGITWTGVLIARDVK